MPSNAAVQRFAAHAGKTLEEPIKEYYKQVESLRKRPGPFTAMRLAGAKSALADDLVSRLERLMADAAFIGTNGNPLTSAQVSALRTAFETQARYMRGFIAQIEQIPIEKAIPRVRSYVSAIVQMISGAAVVGLPKLPHYPGDKSLSCKGYCKCHLEIKTLEGFGNYDVVWVLGDANHCEDCERLAAEWRPLKIRNGLVEGGKALSWAELRKLWAMGVIAYQKMGVNYVSVA